MPYLVSMPAPPLTSEMPPAATPEATAVLMPISASAATSAGEPAPPLSAVRAAAAVIVATAAAVLVTESLDSW